MTRKQLPIFSLGVILAFIVNPQPIFAHNTIIEYQATEAIAIQAKFDDGKPISNAQVVVYAPNDPSQPWQKGLTDENGKFTFIPDYQNQGNWSIKVRSAGHGNVINIPIKTLSSNPIESSSSNGHNDQEIKISNSTQRKFSSSSAQTNQNAPLSLTQKLMMAMMGGWGFVGTALFFSRKNKTVN